MDRLLTDQQCITYCTEVGRVALGLIDVLSNINVIVLWSPTRERYLSIKLQKLLYLLLGLRSCNSCAM